MGARRTGGAPPRRPRPLPQLLDRLRTRGWRLTAQRLAVARALSGDNVHLTADDVHARAVAHLPEISRATVYNTLNELAAMGEIAVVAPDGRANRYDPNVVHPHHHLHCIVCGRLEDVPPARVAALAPADAADFAVLSVDVVFRGRCAACG